MKLSDLELTNMIPDTRVRSNEPLRRLIRNKHTASQTRELMRTLARGNNPDNRPEAAIVGGGDDGQPAAL